MTNEKLGSIEEEAAACRAAFAGVTVGAWVLFCHHNIIVEQLSEPPENRISYILRKKPENERAARLHWFRPLSQTIADDYRAKREPIYDDYRAKCDQLDDDYRAKNKPIYDDYRAKREQLDDDYRAKRDPIDDDYRAKREQLDDDLMGRHLPGCPWNGKTLFPEEEA